ncbi:MAG: 1-(5-phosphoribosyl)-5-[(5-phosphoribosylamino)methylideneamino]imidazole-4-carboxamide isomerase [Candidatus Thermoplasmatota archaeon]|nr:1-(5-phosphoribosyl)-5-[(5-phosphoribosylamino)methylideneamino]imidazole-4-carboxamide isomerase [Candidatus Thermoplasmatota archaeon]
MKIIPSIDLHNGKVVKLLHGKLNTGIVLKESALELAIKWREEGADWLHLVDLDAALGIGNNLKTIEEIIEKVDIKVQVGGGIRATEKACELLEKGANRIIVGTRAVIDIDWLKELASKLGSKIIVAVDSKNDKILVKGWQENSGKNLAEYVKDVEKLNLCGFLYTNIKTEGSLKGIELEPIKKLRKLTSKEILVSGGICRIEDLKKLHQIGIDGAVLGMALYKKKINFGEAIKELKRYNYIN